MVVESHLRSDAARNLARILDAARDVFAERGLDASVADVAERAGVGTATIFRRFPTKEDLCAAVMRREIDDMVAVAEEAPDLDTFLTRAIERFVSNRCLCEVAGTHLFERPELVEQVVRVQESVEGLLRREQKAGRIRGDVVGADIGFLLGAIGQQGLRLERTAPGAWRRYAELALDGLRPEGATKLKHKPPTPQQLHEAKTSGSPS